MKLYSPCVLNTDHRALARVAQGSVMQASHSKRTPKQRRGGITQHAHTKAEEGRQEHRLQSRTNCS